MGDDHSCALAESGGGGVVCWGFDQREALWPPEGLRAVQISAGYDISCALTAEGRVRCWGELEDPPEEMQALGFTAVDVGHEHACAITMERRVLCWPAGPADVPVAIGG